ncbi:MAG TPA: threonine ammonia-lyase [Actinomycetota bacterium]
MTLLSVEQIRQAAARLDGVLTPTALEVSDSLSALAGREIWLKHEERQRTGSYKIRGAYNKIAQLAPGTEVVAASAGNHAQGVARAARLTGCKATIFMPSSAALPKVAATRADGADVRLEGAVVDESIAAAREYAGSVGATFVHPFDDPVVMAGQGTVGLEIATGCPANATVVVPVGGGGLVSGVATAIAAELPEASVIGVEASGAAAVRASLDRGEVVSLDRVETIADGIAVRTTTPLILEHVRARVADVVTVDDDQTSAAMLTLLERAKTVVEPAGAVGLAAVLAGRIPGSGPVVCLLSGGNVDPLLLIRLIEHGLSSAGRYLVLRVILADQPGALAALTGAVAEMGLNVLEVEHHRVGLALGVDRVEVLLTVETRDPEHRAETVRALEARGFTVELLT